MSGYAIDWSSGLLWSVFAIGFVVGCLMTYFVIRRGTRAAQLKKELDRVRAEHEDYRRQVHDHFGKTSVLFQRMTGSYRAVYDHLVQGSQSLCDDRTMPGRIEFPQARLLSDRGNEQGVSAGSTNRAKTGVDQPVE